MIVMSYQKGAKIPIVKKEHGTNLTELQLLCMRTGSDIGYAGMAVVPADGNEDFCQCRRREIEIYARPKYLPLWLPVAQIRYADGNDLKASSRCKPFEPLSCRVRLLDHAGGCAA